MIPIHRHTLRLKATIRGYLLPARFDLSHSRQRYKDLPATSTAFAGPGYVPITSNRCSFNMKNRWANHCVTHRSHCELPTPIRPDSNCGSTPEAFPHYPIPRGVSPRVDVEQDKLSLVCGFNPGLCHFCCCAMLGLVLHARRPTSRI